MLSRFGVNPPPSFSTIPEISGNFERISTEFSGIGLQFLKTKTTVTESLLNKYRKSQLILFTHDLFDVFSFSCSLLSGYI